MIKKCVALLVALIFPFLFTGCGENEIHQKLVADGVLIANDKLMFIVDSKGESKIYSVDYTTFQNSCEEIKKEYDYEPFLSHTNEIYISTDISVKKLKQYIRELKDYYQISPDMKIYLAEDSLVNAFTEGTLTSAEVTKSVENQQCCDERLCHYDNMYKDNEFAVLAEKEGVVTVTRQMI
jgi:hypothetical protein